MFPRFRLHTGHGLPFPNEERERADDRHEGNDNEADQFVKRRSKVPAIRERHADELPQPED
jgi:hypothetical protein